MLKVMMPLVLATLLAGCVESGGTPPDRPEMGMIEWNRGGTFSGSSGGRLFADETYVSLSRPPFGEFTETRRTLAPGSYARALAWLRANPIPARYLPDEPACPDYGTDLVSWEGPAAEGRPIRYAASCPNERLTELRMGLARAIAAP